MKWFFSRSGWRHAPSASPDSMPAELPRMPGMTSIQERECLYRSAMNMEPIGQIVDLGSWLGSLTASLAAGAMANPRLSAKSTKVYAYDTFQWSFWMTPLAAAYGIHGFRDGESFLPEFRRLTAKWESLIEVRVGDLAAAKWDGGPIAILSIDAMKEPVTAKAIVTSFFPSLVEGKSLVFQQDFAHFYTSWIHLIWWRMRDALELLEDLPESGGSLYRYARKIDPDRYDAILDLEGADDREWSEAFAYSRSTVSREKVHKIAAAEVMRFLHAGRGKDAAEAMLHHRDQRNWGPETELVMATPEWKASAAEHWTRLDRR